MKKTVKISIIFITLLLIAVFICFYLKGWFAVQLGTDYMSKDEICNVLTDNLDDFENAVEVLSKSENSEDYYVKIATASYNSIPFVELLFRNQIEIEADENTASKEFENKVKNSSVRYILSELDFVIITATSDYICFINRTAVGSSPQIVYSKNSKSPDSTVFENIEHIIDNWYYCS